MTWKIALSVMAALACAAWTTVSPAASEEAAGAARSNGRNVAQWIERLGAANPAESREARDALIGIGTAAAPEVMALIEKRDPKTADALFILGGTKEVARQVVPGLREIAAKQEWPPETWIPFYRAIAGNEDEEPRIRWLAFEELKNIGGKAIPVLSELLSSDEESIRAVARQMLVQVLNREQGLEGKARFFARLVEEDPFGRDVLDYLTAITGRSNSGRTHPMREKVKAIYRKRLSEKPDPALAERLATIIQDQLDGTALLWEMNVNGLRGSTARECPSESFDTLAEVLELGRREAREDDGLRTKFGIALAKLRLLQGDWKGMNAALTQLGYTTIPEQDRDRLPAPPKKWEQDLHSQWGTADPSMRSGDCSLVVRVEKDGRGLAGFHVALKRYVPPPPDRGFRFSGLIRLGSGLFDSPEPFGKYTFGCDDRNRAKTRYAVSDASGEVCIDKLPETTVTLSILIPTGNFPEAARSWDVWMEVAPGQFLRTVEHERPGAVSYKDPRAIVRLQKGKTVRYPLLVIRPRYDFNIEDFGQVDPENFALRWPGFKAPADQKVRYELTMSLTRPGQLHGGAENMPQVRTTKEVTGQTSWPVAEKGVGGMRLAPGNMYVFEVKAGDGTGTTLARWGPMWVWVPWRHRESHGAVGPSALSDEMPIPDDLYYRWNVTYRKERVNFPQWVDRWLGDNPKAFEREYVAVIQAWLAWHDGKAAEARKQLIDLVRQLSKGNVAQATAISLLGEMDASEKPPRRLRRLKFVAFEDLDPKRVSTLAGKLAIKW